MSSTYQIKLPQFEGPFDLLLFFIERDELDIYNIPIHQITQEFLDYIHELEQLNIELASEFILFVSTLMRIKSRMLLELRRAMSWIPDRSWWTSYWSTSDSRKSPSRCPCWRPSGYWKGSGETFDRKWTPFPRLIQREPKSRR